MKDSGGTSGKAIKAHPEELIFDQVGINQILSQQLVLKNNLSASVELILKTSNSERIDIEPKIKKLAPFESFTADVTVKIVKQLPAKTQKQKETIFIKSDFFDQKINVTIIPSLTSSTTPRDTSIGSSYRQQNQGVAKIISKRGTSRENIQPSIHVQSKELSPPRFQNQVLISEDDEVSKELELKTNEVEELQNKVQQLETVIQEAYQTLYNEKQKRAELEEKYNYMQTSATNEYLDQVKNLLREREPNLETLMDLTLRKEKEKNEQKDAKVLEILRIKDQQLNEMQQKLVQQETEYGNLAQAYQELKRQFKIFEEENERKLITQNDDLQSKISLVQNQQIYQKIQQLEDDLYSANQLIERLQDQSNMSDQNVMEQSQKETYYQEIIKRLKEQLSQKDERVQEIEANLDQEKERRARDEEYSKSLMQQINQINTQQINERNQNVNKIRSEKDHLEKINLLQNEKFELLNDIEAQRKEYQKDYEKIRNILERLSQVRGYGNSSYQQTDTNQQLISLIEKKVEEVARILKEMEDDNISLNQKLVKQQSILTSKEQEIQSLIQENEELSSLTKSKKKKNQLCQTQLKLPEVQDLTENYEEAKQIINELKQNNQKLDKQVQAQKNKIKEIQEQLDNANQELALHFKGHRKHSPSTQSALTQYGNKIDQEEVINALNGKISSLKLNEGKLQDEIQYLRKQAFDQQTSQNKALSSYSQYEPSENKKYIGLEERLSSYEVIIMDQREKLIQLEQANADLIEKINEITTSQINEKELNIQKIKHLTEVNKKFEAIQFQQQMFESNYLTSKVQSESHGFSHSHSAKSTAADTERMRQFTQQLELNNISYKHEIQELQMQQEQLQRQLHQIKEELHIKVRELIILKETFKISSIDINTLIQSSDSSKVLSKVQEQKQKIKQLELALEQYKNGSYAKNDVFQMSPNKQSGWTGQRIEDLYKSNEVLRKENQQVLMSMMEVKEEYTQRLSDFADKYDIERQKLKNDNMSTLRRLEALQSQMSYMEKKEIRLFGQLEETKLSLQQETDEKEKRTKELEELLFKKEEFINELEREIKSKEKSIQERQEQISILIETLENDHSTDQLRQKVLNLSAELCSLKAIQAQQERKNNEITQIMKKVEMNSMKNLKNLEQERNKCRDLLKEVSKLEKDQDEHMKTQQELQVQLDEKSRDYNEAKYKAEREEFQLQMKEEQLNQLKDQLRRYEQSFREEVEKLKREFIEKLHNSLNRQNDQDQSQKSYPFKQSLNQLNIILSDLFESGSDQQEQVIIKELEKTLIIASQNIERLGFDVDKERKVNCGLQNEYRAHSHNNILIMQHEQQVKQIQKLQSILNQREEDKSKYIKAKDLNYNKILKEHQIRLQLLEKENEKLQDENSEIQQELREVKIQKEENETELVCFQQEIQNQKQAMEKQAELQVDERFKAKNEIIRTYFDQQINKILLNQGNSDKIIELGREICSLKLVIDKLEKKILSEQTEKESLDINVQYYKEQHSQALQKIRDIQLKNANLISKLSIQDISLKMEVEKKRQDNLVLEKELIKLREHIEALQRDQSRLEEQLINTSSEQQKLQLKEKKHTYDDVDLDKKLQGANQTIQNLQDQLMDIRSQNIQDMEEMRSQYELELAEAKREILKEKNNLEKKYNPGQAPGDVIEQNDKLKQKLVEMRQGYEHISQENIVLKKKLEQEKIQNETQKNSIFIHKKALADLEITLMEASTFQGQSSIDQQIPKRKSEEAKRKSNGQKSDKKDKKKQLHHFNKESIQYDDQQSHSKILHQDNSSLDVSALTSMNIVTNRYSQSLAQLPRQFVLNPPLIVKALIQSKINEVFQLKKCEELAQNEIQLRDQLKNLLSDKHNIQIMNPNEDAYEYRKRILELEIENEDLKIQRAQHPIDNNKLTDTIDAKKHEQPTQDFPALIESVIQLSNQVAYLENQYRNNDSQVSRDDETVEVAQRLVIKCLTNAIQNGRSSIAIQYVPQVEHDKKIWYLELLEAQLDNADQSVKNLQTFIKKLQIDIQGNLQSAAQIKAASMDLAQNTKHASEEIKTMRHVLGLIKHDLTSFKGKTINTLNSKTINPFQDNIDQRVYQNNGSFESLLQSNESLQNQLTIIDKVKKTLEQEIVQMRIVHLQEMQDLKQQFKVAKDQRDSLLQTNEELHQKVQHLDQNLDNLKKEINNTQVQKQTQMNQMIEKEKERDSFQKSKITTQKHLQKLQTDMHEWRMQTEENMKSKDKQIFELTQQVKQLQTDKDRLKSENNVIKRSNKQNKDDKSELVIKLQQENEELQENIQKVMEERSKEVEFWVSERATMREMIEQLETDKVGIEVNEENGGQIKALKKKNHKKLKNKEIEIKNKEKELQNLKDELSKVKLTFASLEFKIRESGQKNQETEERLRYFQQKFKEVELEKELVLAEKNNAISSNDITAQQIQQELNSLRECFAKLKIERDMLLSDMNDKSNRDKEWRMTVEKLNEEMQQMEQHLISKEKDARNQLKVIEAKQNALFQDAKFLKSENERLKLRLKEQEEADRDSQKNVHELEMKLQESKFQVEDLNKQVNDLQSLIRMKENMVKESHDEILKGEGKKYMEIEELRNKITEAKEVNSQIIVLYENQLDILKQKFMQELKKPEQKVEGTFQLAQREAVIKNLKKELQQIKIKLSKVKNKNKELKTSLSNNQENMVQSSNSQTNKMQNLRASSRVKKSAESVQLDSETVKIAQQIMQDGGIKELYSQLQKINSQVLKMAQLETDLHKSENWNIVLSQQLKTQQDQNNDISQEFDNLSKKLTKEVKTLKQTNNNSSEIKQLRDEMEKLREERISPQDHNQIIQQKEQIQEQLREQQQQVRNLKEEVQRKRDVIRQLKSQREQTEVEASQIIQDMEGLKDDNMKLQKVIKENLKGQQALKEGVSKVDQLKSQEKYYKDEIMRLKDKVKDFNVKAANKDQMIKELREKLERINEEVNISRDYSRDVEKYKEMAKKHKVEAEIKDNQVKALKQKLDVQDGEIEALKQQNASSITNSQITQQQIDSQMKVGKNKLKKYEAYLKKSLEALKKIGKELVIKQRENQFQNKAKGKNSGNPMLMSELEKEIYKDSVNILGVSIDELEEFINPSMNDQSHLSNNKSEVQVIIDKACAILESLNQDFMNQL